MIEYANESVIKALKQYDMLSKSLKFTTDLKQKQEICYQMTRIIQRVLEITNAIYEDKYLKVANRSTYLMDEEKNRLLELINLVNERRTYVNNQIANNVEITGISFDSGSVLGEDKIEEYKEQVKIIEKYKNNIKLNGVLKEEIADLDVSIKKANDKISSNKILNKQLESKMIKLLDNAFDKLSLFELQEREKEIDLAYTELGYSLEKAKENAKIARKDCSSDIILECDNMLASITLEYERYKEKKLILRLIEIYKNPTDGYDELLSKREEINSILSGIVSSELYLEVGEELNKEYATIKLEQQDVATLKSLMEERDSKKVTLEEINRENDSEQFKGILSNLLENEKKYQERLLLERKKREEEEKARELEEERRKQEEILRRQKALEEERKKEIEERTKQLLVEKKNPILFASKEDKNKEAKNLERKINQNVYNSASLKSEVREKRDVKTKDGNALSSVRGTGDSVSSNLGKENIRKDRTTGVSVRPSDDIFSREQRNTRKVNDGIPVIKNRSLGDNVVSSRKETRKEDVFPKVKLDKEKDIFPAFPDMNKNDSFFDDDEFKDLNKYMEDDSKNSWF